MARIDRIRVRPAGKTIFIDLMLSVGRTLSLEQVRAISEEVTNRIRAELPDADILVHTQPLALDNETVADQVRLIASAHRIAAHHILVQRLDGRTCISFDLEVDGRLSIKAAHDIASTIENAVRAELGDEVVVESHIDPLLPDWIEEAHAPTSERAAELTALLQHEVQTFPDIIDLHNLQIRVASDGVHIAFHCRFQDKVPLGQVHEIANRLEYRLYKKIPDARRIIIHAEPKRHVDYGNPNKRTL